MKRSTTLQTSALVVILGLSQALPSTAQTPSATADLPASEDLASLLPQSLGGVALTLESYAPDVMQELMDEADPEAGAGFASILDALGKEPSDMHMARAQSADDDAPAYQILAWRIVGVDAEQTLTMLLAAQLGNVNPDDPTVEADLVAAVMAELSRQDSRDRTYYVSNREARFVLFYPRGEVLFMVRGDGGVSSEEVMAALP